MTTIVRLAVSAGLALAAFGATGAPATETCRTVTERPDVWWTDCANPSDPDHEGGPCARYEGRVVVYVQPPSSWCVG